MSSGTEKNDGKNSARASADLTSSVLDTIPDGLAVVDKQWRITYLNPVAERILRSMQRKPTDMLATVLWESIPDLIGTRLYDEYQRAMREQTPVEFEEFLPPQEAWYDVRGYPSEQGLLIYFHDISTRKRTAEALLENTRLVALTADVGIALATCENTSEMLGGCTDAMVKHLDAAFARIWTLNTVLNVLELQASSGMYTHLDGDHGRVPVGKFKIGLIAQDRKPHLTNSVVGDSRVSEQEWAKREGMVSFAGYPLIVDDRIVGVVAMFARRPLSEVTLRAIGSVADEIAVGIERKRTEETLSQSQERFRAAVEAVGDIIWTTNAIGQMEGEQPGWAEFTGQAQEEYQEFGWIKAIHPDDAQASLHAWTDAVAQGKMFAFEHRLKRQDGAWRLFAIRAVPVLNADGTIREWVGVHTDITERRKQEEERRRLLEREQVARRETETERERVAALAKELEQQRDQLAGANDELKRSNTDLEALAEKLKSQQDRQATVSRALRLVNRAAARLPFLPDEKQVLETCIETLQSSFRPTVTGIWLDDPASHSFSSPKLLLKASSGLQEAPTPSLPEEINVTLHSYKIGWVARYVRPFVSSDIGTDLQFDHQWVQEHGIVSAAVLPLVAQEELLGVMAVFGREPLPLEAGEVLSTLATLLSGSLRALSVRAA